MFCSEKLRALKMVALHHGHQEAARICAGAAVRKNPYTRPLPRPVQRHNFRRWYYDLYAISCRRYGVVWCGFVDDLVVGCQPFLVSAPGRERRASVESE